MKFNISDRVYNNCKSSMYYQCVGKVIDIHNIGTGREKYRIQWSGSGVSNAMDGYYLVPAPLKVQFGEYVACTEFYRVGDHIKYVGRVPKFRGLRFILKAIECTEIGYLLHVKDTHSRFADTIVFHYDVVTLINEPSGSPVLPSAKDIATSTAMLKPPPTPKKGDRPLYMVGDKVVINNRAAKIYRGRVAEVVYVNTASLDWNQPIYYTLKLKRLDNGEEQQVVASETSLDPVIQNAMTRDYMTEDDVHTIDRIRKAWKDGHVVLFRLAPDSNAYHSLFDNPGFDHPPEHYVVLEYAYRVNPAEKLLRMPVSELVRARDGGAVIQMYRDYYSARYNIHLKYWVDLSAHSVIDPRSSYYRIKPGTGTTTVSPRETLTMKGDTLDVRCSDAVLAMKDGTLGLEYPSDIPGAWLQPNTGTAVVKEFTINVVKETSDQPKEDYTMKFETRYFLNGNDIRDYKDADIYNLIKRSEHDIEQLEQIKNKPLTLKQEIESRKAELKKLIDFLDAQVAK